MFFWMTWTGTTSSKPWPKRLRKPAGRSIRGELTRLAWAASDLADRRKSDPAKLKLAARLRTETTLTIKAIARLLYLGTSKSANIRLHEWLAKSAASAPTPGPPQ
jgi:hypothetical protein